MFLVVLMALLLYVKRILDIPLSGFFKFFVQNKLEFSFGQNLAEPVMES